ncbi:hypothetical protein BT69DRAFT_1282155 [Atractiella rhizophila]|nr:hypothetical protein BT69DRAFT_1282155 [Atractiella rhizophila]
MDAFRQLFPVVHVITRSDEYTASTDILHPVARTNKPMFTRQQQYSVAVKILRE